jgi:hypothetical protein
MNIIIWITLMLQTQWKNVSIYKHINIYVYKYIIFLYSVGNYYIKVILGLIMYEVFV